MKREKSKYIDTLNQMINQTDAEVDLKNNLTIATDNQIVELNILLSTVNSTIKKQTDSVSNIYKYQNAKYEFYKDAHNKGYRGYADSANQMMKIINPTIQVKNAMSKDLNELVSFNTSLSALQNDASKEFNKAVGRANASIDKFNQGVRKANSLINTYGVKVSIGKNVTEVKAKLPAKK